MRLSRLSISLFALITLWLDAAAPRSWSKIWSGEGCPPGQMLNGFLVEGTYLPIEFTFRYDPIKPKVIWQSERAKRLNPALFEWFISKISTDHGFNGVDSKCLLRVTFSGSTCKISLSKQSPAV
jgi:hypothetical protein